MKQRGRELTGEAAREQNANAWRRRLARHLGAAYAAHEGVAAVMLGGSTARGHADAFSDVEIGVFWRRPPREDERRALTAAVSGSAGRFFEYDEAHLAWTDDFVVRGVKIDVVHTLASDLAAARQRIADAGAVHLPAQHLLAAVQSGVPLYGAPELQTWREAAAAYPDALAVKMVRAHLWQTPASGRDVLLERRDFLALFENMTATTRRVLLILFGLNRVYVPHASFKWSSRFAHALALAPSDVARRLERVFEATPREGVRELHALVLDTYALVEAHLPDVDVAAARGWLLRPAPTWKETPDLEDL